LKISTKYETSKFNLILDSFSEKAFKDYSRAKKQKQSTSSTMNIRSAQEAKSKQAMQQMQDN
jgi:hypothetical protein